MPQLPLQLVELSTEGLLRDEQLPRRLADAPRPVDGHKYSQDKKFIAQPPVKSFDFSIAKISHNCKEWEDNIQLFTCIVGSNLMLALPR